MSRVFTLWAAVLLGLLLASRAAVQAGPILLLNELQSSNSETLRDENGDSPDWFELTNAGDQPADLTGWGVSDDLGRPFKWRFASGLLAPDEYLVVYASGKDRQPTEVDPLQPGTIEGLAVWLKADAINPDDPNQVRSVGPDRVVTRWNTSGGILGPAVQTEGARQPEWRAQGFKDVPVVHFDGSDDSLRLDRSVGTNGFTLIAVARASVPHEIESESAQGVGGTSGQRWLFGPEHGGDWNGGAGLSLGNNGASVYEHGSGYMPALAVAPFEPRPTFVLVSVVYDDRRPRLYLDGTLAREGLRSPRSAVTAPIEIGAGAYGAFGGDVAEILLFNRALTETERHGLEAGLAAKYHLTLARYYHTGFQLSAAGEVLTLTRPDGSTADTVGFGILPRDVSYGRPAEESQVWRFFAQPTPGRSNSTPGSTAFLTAPEFSHPAGFFPSEFVLTLSTDSVGAEIRYTLDGSEPSATAALSSGSLRIGSRTGTPNGISSIPTTPGGPLPTGEVFKGWVIRARTFKPGALPSEVVTRSFFVTPSGRARYSVPVVSLVTDRDNFFSMDRGIYVPGTRGNYNQRGPEWERPAFVELFETNNSVLVSQPVGVKIHGNTSQNFPIKGLDLDATAFTGRRHFTARLFPDRARTDYEHVLLRPTGHDQLYAFQRDELMQSLLEPFGVETQAARLVVVFINGEYWGLHYLKDKQDTAFVAQATGISEDELDYLEGYAVPRAGNLVRWNEMMAYLQTHDLTDTAHYAWMTNCLDPVNYALYKAGESFTYRWDIGNHRFWRPRTPEGRFRWLQFDNDVGWGGFWADQPAWEFDMLAHQLAGTGGLHGHSTADTTRLLGGLMRNADFRRLFLNVYADLLNSVYQPSESIGRIDALTATLAPEIAEHLRRWRAPASVSEWQGHIAYLRNFARNRPAAVRRQLETRFKPSGPIQLSLAVSDPVGGSIRTTLLTVTNTPAKRWTGTYFKFNPLTLRAEARPGWRFAGWRELPGVPATVTLGPTSDVALTAEFVAVPLMIETIRRVEGDRLQLSGTAPAGVTLQMQTSADLRTWQSFGPVITTQDGRWETTIETGLRGSGWWRLAIQF